MAYANATRNISEERASAPYRKEATFTRMYKDAVPMSRRPSTVRDVAVVLVADATATFVQTKKR